MKSRRRRWRRGVSHPGLRRPPVIIYPSVSVILGPRRQIATSIATTNTNNQLHNHWLHLNLTQGEAMSSSIGGGGGGIVASSSSSSSSSTGANYGFGVGLAGGASTAVAHQGQGVAALLVMLAVLCFMFAYCCWGAPFCRSLCRRHCYCCNCCCCRPDDFTDSESGGFGSTALSAHRPDHSIINTPTIILLPHGRTFVVHGRIFTQFQADNTGLDLVELGESVMRAQRGSGSLRHHQHQHHHHRQLQNSQNSIIEMDAETPSKESMGSIGCFPPPTYESIYGKDEQTDLPPSYSDILLHRFANLPYDLEMQDYSHQQAHGTSHHQSQRHNYHHHHNHHNHENDPEDSSSSKEGLELRVGPRIISNPIAGNFPVHPPRNTYASRSLPRRNPSLISNPLDSYLFDNELAGLHRIAALGQRRRSAAAEVTSSRRPSLPAVANNPIDDSITSPRTNSHDFAPTAEIILGNRFASSRSQASRSQNDLMNSRNVARSDESRRSGNERELYVSEGRIVTMSRISRRAACWNYSEPDVRYATTRDEELPASAIELIVDSIRPENHQVNQEEEDEDEESAAAAVVNNFQALADIRESRV